MTRSKQTISTILCIVIALCFFSACHYPIGPTDTFSYNQDADYYFWGITEGFNNTTKSIISNKYHAIRLAKNEVTVDYNEISVCCDDTCDMWRIHFWKRDWIGGGQLVYLNNQGLTVLVVDTLCEEPPRPSGE